MESKNTLSIKRYINELGQQHNKLTTLVVALLGEIDKLKTDIITLKTSDSVKNVHNTYNDIDTNNIKVIGHTSGVASDSENRAEDILRQLSVQDLSTTSN